ncbi:MAG: hypothetical protein OXT03_01030 [Alphaproteobacteria bacterium]|nr:hypothetical protein [Alphaproteobacteria bacterium]
MSLIYRTTDSRRADACYIGSQKSDDKGGMKIYFSVILLTIYITICGADGKTAI